MEMCPQTACMARASSFVSVRSALDEHFLCASPLCVVLPLSCLRFGLGEVGRCRDWRRSGFGLVIGRCLDRGVESHRLWSGEAGPSRKEPLPSFRRRSWGFQGFPTASYSDGLDVSLSRHPLRVMPWTSTSKLGGVCQISAQGTVLLKSSPRQQSLAIISNVSIRGAMLQVTFLKDLLTQERNSAPG
jgi:hypothetical protein